jgi:cysteine desulfurase/selenocysteine lyase
MLPKENESASQTVDYWKSYREVNFPVAQKWSYFDHAAVSPLSLPAQQAIQQWLRQATEDGDAAWPLWSAQIEEIRCKASELFRAGSSELAFIPNTTFGISLVAEGLDWNAGDNIVIPAGEFPSNLYPWMQLTDLGVELRIVPTGEKGEIRPEEIDELCDSNTRLVSCSWVGYGKGFRINPQELAEVAHANGALFFLDAIQGLGVFPLDVKKSDIDFFSADGHKWLMGPEGAGLFYCKAGLLKELRPSVVGWNSMNNPHDFGSTSFQLKNTAGRFEPGTHNMSGILGMGGSLDLIAETGLTPESSPIAERVLVITDRIETMLCGEGFQCHSCREADHKSGIISFSKKGTDPAALRSELLKQGVVTSVRNQLLRLSPHAYACDQDLEKMMEVLSRF